MIIALSAIVLNSDFRKMKNTGLKPIFLALIVWFNVAAVSLLVQFITGQI